MPQDSTASDCTLPTDDTRARQAREGVTLSGEDPPSRKHGTPALPAQLAHELRTPLAAVAAYAELLAREQFGPLGDARYRDYAGHIHASALHALGVIERMAAGDVPREMRTETLRFRDLDPSCIVESCIAVMRPIAKAAGVELRASFPARLPRVVADDVALRQMLLNLLTNAVKFARPGDHVVLAVRSTADGGLDFAVEDTGPGLAATHTGADSQNAKGLGLGLPLTRDLARANGAELALESEPGAGTRATISFDKSRVVPV